MVSQNVKRFAKRWSARGVFLIAVLGLLATSKPKGWSLTAAMPAIVTSPFHGLAVTIDSSAEPTLRAHGVSPTYRGGAAPCLATWAKGAKTTCLLPPGAILDGVDIEGSCGGCKGGCPPPPGSFVNVSTAEVGVWSASTNWTIPAALPDHNKDFIATRFEARVSGAEYITVRLEVMTSPGVNIFAEEQSCSRQTYAYCMFTVMDSVVPPGTTASVTAFATGWGECRGAGPCASPSTLKIDSLTVVK